MSNQKIQKIITMKEVERHNTEQDCWVIIGDGVYDLTKFMKFHPGGISAISRYAGTEVTQDFQMLHPDGTLAKYKKLRIGTIQGAKMVMEKPIQDRKGLYGDQIPFGDPNWYQGWNSPYYNDSHRVYRKEVRAFVEKEISPYVHRWDEKKKIPANVLKKCSRFLPSAVGPPWPVEYAGNTMPGGIPASEFDTFHELIFVDEFCRAGSGGLVWGLFAGLTIGLPPVLHFGPKAMRDRVIPQCFSGEKVICLAITEPWAGSDVANMRATAVKTEDGKHYIVNGEKKWITNGVFADYFTTAVRTGGKGMNGISLLLIEKGMPGLECKQMNCGGVWSSGTTYVTMHNVKVPVENLIGVENQGFKAIMYNFNHERWWFIAQATRYSRVLLEESFKFANRRSTFGKRLIDQPVIRAKLGEMARQVEATHAWLESLTFQMNTMTKKESISLAGPIALAKVQSTKTMEYCAREAVQIFGGTGYTRGGLGDKVERLYRDQRSLAIPGGSEEIMIDLGIRQAIKRAAKL